MSTGRRYTGTEKIALLLEKEKVNFTYSQDIKEIKAKTADIHGLLTGINHS